MSIADKLTQLTNIRSNIRTKLTEKGVEASEHNFSDFATDIEAIQTGITPTGTIEITENGTYDVTDKAEAVVNVTGEDINEVDLLSQSNLNYVKASGTNILFAIGSARLYGASKYVSYKNAFCQSTEFGFYNTRAILINVGRMYTQTGGSLWSGGIFLKTLIINQADTRYITNLGSNGLVLTPIEKGEGYVYVPDGSVSTFKSKTGWAAVGDQIMGFSNAPDYSESATYSAGDVCKYNGKFYCLCYKAAYLDNATISGNAPTGTTEDNAYWEFVATI